MIIVHVPLIILTVNFYYVNFITSNVLHSYSVFTSVRRNVLWELLIDLRCISLCSFYSKNLVRIKSDLSYDNKKKSHGWRQVFVFTVFIWIFLFIDTHAVDCARIPKRRCSQMIGPILFNAACQFFWFTSFAMARIFCHQFSSLKYHKFL